MSFWQYFFLGLFIPIYVAFVVRIIAKALYQEKLDYKQKLLKNGKKEKEQL